MIFKKKGETSFFIFGKSVIISFEVVKQIWYSKYEVIYYTLQLRTIIFNGSSFDKIAIKLEQS